MLGAFLVALDLLIAIVVEDYQPAELVPVFVLVAWLPLIALHEAGRALAARVVGGHVGEIVVGPGALDEPAMREMVADVLHERARERDGREALRIAPRETHLPQDLVHRFEAGAKP